MVWYAIVFGGMVLLGLIGHVLHPVIDNPETIFFTLTDSLFTPILSGILLAAVLSAIMSTAERLVPFCVSFAVLLLFRQRQ